MFGLRKPKRKTPEDLTLEELLSGVNVGEYGSWYEHEIFRKVERRYALSRDRGRFLKAEVPALPGYDALATEVVYRSRGIEAAFVLQLPDVEQFRSPACAVYVQPKPASYRSADDVDSWSIACFYAYEVLPRFYEPISIHELLGWKLIERFPPAGPGSGDDESGSRLDETTGVMTFEARPDGASRARDYAALLKTEMEKVGVLCDPVVALATTPGYDPLRPEDPQRNTSNRPHPYDARSDSEGDISTDNPRRYVKPEGHRVVPTAGPKVPDQAAADDMVRRLREYAFWAGLVENLDERMDDPKIPPVRLAALVEQRQEAVDESGRLAGTLLEEPARTLGLLLSMNDAVETMTDALYPVVISVPGGERLPMDLVPLELLRLRLGNLFSSGLEGARR